MYMDSNILDKEAFVKFDEKNINSLLAMTTSLCYLSLDLYSTGQISFDLLNTLFRAYFHALSIIEGNSNVEPSP